MKALTPDDSQETGNGSANSGRLQQTSFIQIGNDIPLGTSKAVQDGSIIRAQFEVVNRNQAKDQTYFTAIQELNRHYGRFVRAAKLFQRHLERQSRGKLVGNLEILQATEGYPHPSTALSEAETEECVRENESHEIQLLHAYRVTIFTIMFCSIFSIGVTVNYCILPGYAGRGVSRLLQSDPPVLLVDEVLSSDGDEGSDDEDF